MSKVNAILLIGFDSNLSLGVLYCLKSLNYDIYLLTSNMKNAARFSRFLKKIYYESDKNDIKKIIEIVKNHNIDLIMPIDELEIRNVKVHSKELNKIALCSWATDVDKFDIGINKHNLARFLTENKIPCPSFSVIGSLAKLKQDSENMGYPILIKPDRGSFGRMIRRFENWKDLKNYYVENENEIKNYIIQPFIIGSDITCNVICMNGELICHTIQESPVKTGDDFSSNDILEFHDDAEVIKVVSTMMKLLNWHGVACVDMRRDIRDNSVKVLEINGRFWASVVSSYIRTGLNFPIIMAKLALDEEIVVPKARPGRQLSLKQTIYSKLSGKGGTFKDTKYTTYFADPLARIAQIFKI